MNVILLENVENLGSIGDLVKVKPGNSRRQRPKSWRQQRPVPARSKAWSW
jgi:hypothetical protein